LAASYKQSGRLLSFSSPAVGEDVLLANAFQGEEAISELFCFDVELLSTPDMIIDPDSIVGSRATLQMLLDTPGEERYFNGIVSSFLTEGGDPDFIRYRARLRPSLWLLSLNTQTRVFQNKTVIEIVEQVLEPYTITPDDRTEASYTELEYCTQYRETDLEFVSRLLEQHGIFYYFTHTQFDHKLTLVDDVRLLRECPVQDSYSFRSGDHHDDASSEARVKEFASEAQQVPGKYVNWDFRFIPYEVSEADKQSASGRMGDNAHEWNDYADSASAYLKTPGGDAKMRDLQTQLLTVRKERSEAQAVKCRGASTGKTLQSGFTFQLLEHPVPALNQKYTLARVEHHALQHPGYRSDVSHGQVRYENTFHARPFTQPFRSNHPPRRPRVFGVVTGKVVTPAGDETYVDRFGRVCVQFWWDGKRPPNTVDNTMLRVSQLWAGKGWGTYFWPRIDDEVLIGFLEGDPDAPIIVGSVYNGKHLPKYDPETYATRSGIVTRSSKHGGENDANELRFEDETGSEQIFLKARRDMDYRTLNDHRRWVGKNDSLKVMGARYESIEKNYESLISGSHIESVNQSIDLSAGAQVVVTANGQISLSVAGSFLTIGSEGIAISGPMVRINSGGSAAETPRPPLPPDTADDGTRGGKMP
jgi:type VI secretion system secreted protein VgrG